MKVKLRKRKIANGRETLYLDIYSKGQRRNESLGLYLEAGTSREVKKKNRETMELAEKVAAKTLMELQHQTHSIKTQQESRMLFMDYFGEMVEHRRKTGVNFETWRSTLKHLRDFPDNKIRLNDVDERWLENFRAFLLGRLSQNSAHTYFNKIKRIIHTASREGLISNNPAYQVSSPAMVDTKREYLTESELIQLAQTECRKPILKIAFLFSALTGMRWSDIHKMKWSEVRYSAEQGHQIDFSQRKTKAFEYLPITEQARELLGEEGPENFRVFKGLSYSAENNLALGQWVLKAKIPKHITFHCARHTYATLLLTKGADIYTVSKLLGHKEIRTTQVYGKIVDELKVKAVNTLPRLDLG